MKKIFASILCYTLALAAFVACSDDDNKVSDIYEKGVPTLSASIETTEAYSVTLDVTSNKVTRLFYYLVQANTLPAPTTSEVYDNGLKEGIFESAMVTIPLECHSSYTVYFVGQGLDKENKTIFTEVEAVNVTTPADPQLELDLSSSSSYFTLKLYTNDVETVYYLLCDADDSAPTFDEICNSGVELSSIYGYDSSAEKDYFRIRYHRKNDLVAGVAYTLYYVGVNSDGTRTEIAQVALQN